MFIKALGYHFLVYWQHGKLESKSLTPSSGAYDTFQTSELKLCDV